MDSKSLATFYANLFYKDLFQAYKDNNVKIGYPEFAITYIGSLKHDKSFSKYALLMAKYFRIESNRPIDDLYTQYAIAFSSLEYASNMSLHDKISLFNNNNINILMSFVKTFLTETKNEIYKILTSERNVDTELHVKNSRELARCFYEIVSHFIGVSQQKMQINKCLELSDTVSKFVKKNDKDFNEAVTQIKVTNEKQKEYDAQILAFKDMLKTNKDTISQLIDALKHQSSKCETLQNKLMQIESELATYKSLTDRIDAKIADRIDNPVVRTNQDNEFKSVSSVQNSKVIDPVKLIDDYNLHSDIADDTDAAEMLCAIDTDDL